MKANGGRMDSHLKKRRDRLASVLGRRTAPVSTVFRGGKRKYKVVIREGKKKIHCQNQLTFHTNTINYESERNRHDGGTIE